MSKVIEFDYILVSSESSFEVLHYASLTVPTFEFFLRFCEAFLQRPSVGVIPLFVFGDQLLQLVLLLSRFATHGSVNKQRKKIETGRERERQTDIYSTI